MNFGLVKLLLNKYHVGLILVIFSFIELIFPIITFVILLIFGVILFMVYDPMFKKLIGWDKKK